MPRIPKSCFWSLKPVGYLCFFLKNTVWNWGREKKNYEKNEREKAGLRMDNAAWAGSNPHGPRGSFLSQAERFFQAEGILEGNISRAKFKGKFPFISSRCWSHQTLALRTVRDVENR